MPPTAVADPDVLLPHRMLHRRPYRVKSARFDFPRAARFLRRSRLLRLLLVLPLFYVSALLMCVGTFSFAGTRPLPGSVYRSGVVFARLWPEMQADGGRNSTPPALQLSTVWRHMKRLEETKPCSIATVKKSRTLAPTGYLIVEANGGLNQQRSSICNAVAVAGLLNAVLVIPHFQFHSVWKDPSEFRDIYDEDRFIHILEKHVHIVKKIPEALMEIFDYNISNIPILKVKAWAPAAYYTTAVYPLLNGRKVIRIAPFANRLALDVPPSIQALRCLTNYRALRFSEPIRALASKLVTRMKRRSSAVGGKYISIHLRFEEDMVAFSCCEYDGGKEEKIEMEHARERGWRGKFRRNGRVITPGLYRINGKCPLTPLEVGMMLRGMGFDNTTSIYLASGKIYRAEKNLAPLLRMFPLLQTKESLATPEELASFKDYSSRLAALDYTVCVHSEVFVTTQGGNFPQFLEGHRRYLNNGHAKTIKPDKRTLVQVLHNTSISWQNFKDQMQPMLVDNDKKGGALRKDGQSIYAYPFPECMCTSNSAA